jgi:hypothetical protein
MKMPRLWTLRHSARSICTSLYMNLGVAWSPSLLCECLISWKQPGPPENINEGFRKVLGLWMMIIDFHGVWFITIGAVIWRGSFDALRILHDFSLLHPPVVVAGEDGAIPPNWTLRVWWKGCENIPHTFINFIWSQGVQSRSIMFYPILDDLVVVCSVNGTFGDIGETDSTPWSLAQGFQQLLHGHSSIFCWFPFAKVSRFAFSLDWIPQRIQWKRISTGVNFRVNARAALPGIALKRLELQPRLILLTWIKHKSTSDCGDELCLPFPHKKCLQSERSRSDQRRTQSHDFNRAEQITHCSSRVKNCSSAAKKHS